MSTSILTPLRYTVTGTLFPTCRSMALSRAAKSSASGMSPSAAYRMSPGLMTSAAGALGLSDDTRMTLGTPPIGPRAAVAAAAASLGSL